MKSPSRFPRLLAILILTLALAAGFNLAIRAQGPDNGEPESLPEEKVTPVEEIELTAGMDDPGLAIFYKRWSADTFTPIDESNAWTYTSGGCIHRTEGTSFWDTSLQLPEGATIDFLRVYYYDESEEDASAFLYAFDNIGGAVEIASATGSGTPGYSSSDSDFFSHVVDNQHNTYTLRISFAGSLDEDLRICAVRIRYNFTVETINLPAILNSASP